MSRTEHFLQTKEDVKRDLVELIWTGIYFLLATLILPQLALFFGNAIEESINLTKYTFYNSTLGIVFTFILAIKIINIISYMNKWDFEIPFFLHDPEFSPARNFKVLTDLRTIILISLFLSTLNTLSAISQTSLPEFEQQVTETAKITFAIYPASPAETMTMVALLCILILMPNYYLWKKFKYPFAVFCLINIVLFTIGGGMYGYALHTYRYGSSETAINSVIFFWSLSGLLTASTGSAIPAVVMHDVNNGILSAKTEFGNSAVAVFMGIFLLIVLILLIANILYMINKNKDEGLDYNPNFGKG